MPTVQEIAWLAGLVDGEGSFGKQSRRAAPYNPAITLTMTDVDVVERAARIMGDVAHVMPRDLQWPASYKTPWTVRLTGRRAAAWLMTLYPLMCARRQERFREILIRWIRRPVTTHIGTGHCKRGHDYAVVGQTKRHECRACRRLWGRKIAA